MTTNDADLLAELLNPNAHPAQRAAALLQRAGGWAGLRRLVVGLSPTAELDTTERLRLAAVFEVAHRLLAEPPSDRVLDSPAKVAARYLSLALEDVEHIVAVGLDAGRRILIEHRFDGGTNHVHVHARDLLRPLIASGAVAMIVIHNHPSRNREPSASDLAFTDRLSRAANICDVELLDHMIIAGDQWTSLAERGYLRTQPTARIPAAADKGERT